MMRTGRIGLWPASLTVAVAAVVAVGAAAEDRKQDATSVRTADGLHFQLPPDWPVEKRGGLVAPIPVEEYLTQKFSALENRMQSLEKQVSAFDIRMRVLEEQAKKEQRLKSGESAP
jgi:hypothetical protein